MQLFYTFLDWLKQIYIMFDSMELFGISILYVFVATFTLSLVFTQIMKLFYKYYSISKNV